MNNYELPEKPSFDKNIINISRTDTEVPSKDLASSEDRLFLFSCELDVREYKKFLKDEQWKADTMQNDGFFDKLTEEEYKRVDLLLAECTSIVVEAAKRDFKKRNKIEEVCPVCGGDLTPNHYVDREKGRIYGETCFYCGYEYWDE